MGWKVFLPDSYLDAVENKVHEIACSIEDLYIPDGSLMGGAAGLACFFAFYANWTGKAHYKDLAVEMVEQSLNPAAGNLTDLRFSNGLAGGMWMTHHLSKTGLIEIDASVVYNKLDPFLHDVMMQEMKSGHYDYLHGALGYALYFLRQPKKKQYRDYLLELVLELFRHVEYESDGSMKWRSVLDAEKNIIGYNISLSHGISSIIIILNHILAAGIAVDECGAMIIGSLRHLKKQKLDTEKYMSCYPSWALESEETPTSSRLAWCYGDIGIGLAFLESGYFFPESNYRPEGMKILLESANRKDMKETRVLDAGICHGASGLALIYNTLYQQTGEEAFKDASIYWLDVSISMAVHQDGLAGYKAWSLPEYGGWRNSPGLLEGIAGIGLAMMSFLSTKSPSWSRCLLLHPG